MKIEEMIAPLTRVQFLDQYFRNQPLHCKGGMHAALGDDALGWATANRVLGMYRHMAPGTLDIGIHRDRDANVRVVLDRADTIKLGYNQTRIVSRVESCYYEPRSVAAALKEGAALIVNDAQVLDRQIRDLARAVQTFANGRAFCNLYVTNSVEGPCKAHVDAHDIFVVHAAGRKTWRFHEFHEPDIDHNINPVQRPDFDAGPVKTEIEVGPGDVLYVPWGMAHSVATHEPSLHFSFGFTPPLTGRPGGGRIPDYEIDLPGDLE